MRSGLAVVLLDGDARVLGERLLELGDARLEFLLVRGLLDGRLDDGLLLLASLLFAEARACLIASSLFTRGSDSKSLTETARGMQGVLGALFVAIDLDQNPYKVKLKRLKLQFWDRLKLQFWDEAHGWS